MPVYEYLCPHCNRVFSFLAKSAAAAPHPVCPKCGATDLKRMISQFALGRSRNKTESASAAAGGDTAMADRLDDPRVEREMMQLMGAAENIDENDPRQLGRLMRRMAQVTGERLEPEMEEAVRRLEAGEDPEAIEEAMGDVLDDTGSGPGAAAAPTYDDGLYPM